jgi:acyl-CoA dehydrogenase
MNYGMNVHSIIQRLHDEGYTRLAVARDGAVDVGALCAAREKLAYDSALADAVLAVLGLGAHPVAARGTEAQRARWVDPVAAGQAVCGFALTEPEAGSDVAALATTARRDGSGWILDGKKTFISNATIADWFTVFAKVDGQPAAFVVARDELKVVDDVPMSVEHPIGSLLFDASKIPGDRLIGAIGDGIRIALGTLDVFRVSVAAAACGMAARALDESVARVKARRQFGKPLADFQLTQARLADAATELEAARGLVRAACEAIAAKDPSAKKRVAMAKLFATEAAQRIVDGAVQLHGGLGVVRGVKVEELYREVRALRIYEGTSEIQKLIIARELLR